MFDLLGIDWGSKRFGLAFAESSSGLVLAADYACPAEKIWTILDTEINTREISKIIVGRPLNFQGQPTTITNQVDLFLRQLALVYPKISIETVNERNSSKEVLLGQKADKQQTNNLAAARILEYYFGLESR
jgi:putative holliday junction resolvase